MKRTIIGAALGLTAIIGVGAAVNADRPSDNEKVWVCHVVNGQGEFKNGYNLIHVDSSAADGEGRNDHTQHEANDGRRDLIPAPGGANSTCGATPPDTTEPPVETVGPSPPSGDGISELDDLRPVG